jgi:hypothetical protein
MKTTMKRLSLFAAFFVAVSCFGQSIGQTTLAVGASPTDTTITLVSSAGVSAAAGTTVVTGLFIEHEYIEVQTNGGTNVWTVRRAAGGFRGPHLAGTTVYVGRPFDFGVGVTNSRTNPKGNCVAGAQALPYVVIATGDVFTCPTTGANAGIWTLLTPAGSVVTEDVSGNVTVPGNLNFLGNIYRNGTLFSGTWGGIGGTLSAQTDLWTALGGKQPTIAGAPGTWPLSFTPSAHASTHQNGGADEIATAAPAANAIPKAGAGGTLAAGWIPALNYQAPITGAPGTWPSTFAPTAHASTHAGAGSDPITSLGAVSFTGTISVQAGVANAMSISGNGGLYATFTNADASSYPYFSFSRSRGTIASPTSVQVGDTVGGVNFYATGPGGGGYGVAGMTALATGFNGNNILGKFSVNVGDGTSAGANFNAFTATSTLTTFNTPLQVGTYLLERTFPTTTFANGTANQKVDIVFGNVQMVGTFEVTLTGSYNSYPSIGRITKVYSVGVGTGGAVYSGNGTHYSEASGNVPNSFALGDLVWDTTNLVWRIQIADLNNSSGNIYVSIKSLGFAPLSTEVAAATLGSIYTTDSTVLATAAVSFPGPSVVTFSGTGVNLPKVLGTTIIANPNDSSNNLLVAGLTNGIRLGSSLTTATISGIDPTGYASFQPLQINGSFVTLNSSSTEIARVTSTGLGVGTTSPGYSLDVSGIARFDTGGGGNGVLMLGGVSHANTGSSIMSDSGYNSNYNGLYIASNTISSTYTQANTAFSSWGLDIGGYDNITFSGSADSFNILRQAAGGTTPSRLFTVSNTGTVKVTATADSSVNMLVTGLTKAVRIGSSTSAANIDGIDPTGTTSYQPLQINGSFVSFGNSGTEVLRATGGSVGIGTTSPDGTLHVAGTTQITWSMSANTALAVIGSRGTVGGSLWVNTPSYGASYPSGLGVSGTYDSSISTVQLGAYGAYSGGPYGSVLSFLTTNQTTASEKMRIDQNGKVGIATTSPAYGLDVANGVGLSGTARFYDQTATTGATLVTITAGASQTVASTVLSVGGVVKFAGTNSTGSGSALLGANSPATVVSAPYTWIKAIASDGTTVFLPAWK